MNPDITITATKRPELLDIMLSSFKKGMNLSSECRIIINIDPLGRDIPVSEELDVCYKYFTNVHYNTPTSPSYNKALRWLWTQVETKYFLNLEDDWELLRETSLQKMIDIMEADPDLAQLSLRKEFSSPSLTPEGYYKMKNFLTSPSLASSKFVKEALDNLKDDLYFGRQLMTRKVFTDMKYKYGRYCDGKEQGMIRDHGRVWMTKMGFRKNGIGELFTTWIK